MGRGGAIDRTLVSQAGGVTRLWRHETRQLAETQPLACVLGNLDLVRPLGLGGIRCAAVVPPGHPVRFSRFVDATLDSSTPALVDRLLEFARSQPCRPILFFEADDEVELISEERDRLAQGFRFILPPHELVRDLLDKERFRDLAVRERLPVPPSKILSPLVESPPTDLGLAYPLVLKPVPYRDKSWYRMIAVSKVLRIEEPQALSALWDRLAATGLRFLAQEIISGPETRIASYHVYVDSRGKVRGEFTGRKVRTFPLEFGRTTALETTDDPELVRLGREIVERLRWQGVAKLDFKRDSQGRPWLLEVNPRFSLWMHVGAMAGVNLPALMYADLTGRPRQPPGQARAGVRWCWPRPDFAAARELGIPWPTWLRWALGSEAKTNLSLDDPLPFVLGWGGSKTAALARSLTQPRRRG